MGFEHDVLCALLVKITDKVCFSSNCVLRGVSVFVTRYIATANPGRKTNFEILAYMVLDVRIIIKRIFNVRCGAVDMFHAAGYVKVTMARSSEYGNGTSASINACHFID
jgi:hypothetical protein